MIEICLNPDNEIIGSGSGGIDPDHAIDDHQYVQTI